LRFLRRLVTTLTAVMIAGLVIIVALLVIRLGPAPRLSLPDSIALPGGTTATAFTQGTDWIAVVTDSDEILIFSRDGTTLRQRITLGN
jgi:hypothetical protein